MKKIFILFYFGLFCFELLGQQKESADFLKLKKKIILHLKTLNSWAYDYADEKTKIDPDSLADVTSGEFVKLLKQPESINLNLSEFPNTKLSAQTNDSLRIRLYTFSYPSGGIDGDIDCQLIQWTNSKGKLFAFNFSKHFPYAFEKIYNLKTKNSACYLLLANRMFNPSEENCSALVLRFKGDYLFTDYAAFEDTSSFEVYNSEISFDTTTQILQLDFGYDDTGNKNITSVSDDITQYSDYGRDSLKKVALYKLLFDNYKEDENKIELKFNGIKFAGTIPRVPTFQRNPNENLKDFLLRVKQDSSELTDQFFETNWDTTQKIIFSFYAETLHKEVTVKGHTNSFEEDFILGYMFVPIGNYKYERILIDTISSDGGAPKILSVFFADADNDSIKELCVLISWDQLLHKDYSGTLYNTQFYSKPRFLNPPACLSKLDDETFSECDCDYNDGRKTKARFKTAAAVKAELKTRK